MSYLTVSPVHMLSKKVIQFAPIGLVNMLNSGGAIQSLDVDEEGSWVRIGVKGIGEMKMYASERPRRCKIDGVEAEFCYDDDTVTVQVPWHGSPGLSVMEYLF